MTTFTTTKTRTADSTDRIPTLGTKAPAQNAKIPAARDGVVRRLLNTLMRSLATPHV
jgi:hypothetical protein